MAIKRRTTGIHRFEELFFFEKGWWGGGRRVHDFAWLIRWEVRDGRGGKLENTTADGEFTRREKLLHSEFLGINIIFTGSFFGLSPASLFLVHWCCLATWPHCRCQKGSAWYSAWANSRTNGISWEKLWGRVCVCVCAWLVYMCSFAFNVCPPWNAPSAQIWTSKCVCFLCVCVYWVSGGMHVLIGCRLRINLAFNTAQTRNAECQTPHPTSSRPHSPQRQLRRLRRRDSKPLRWDSTLAAARWKWTWASRAARPTLTPARCKRRFLIWKK